MTKKKKQVHIIGRKEFIFNFFSLVIIIGIGLYFGARSMYYYSKQNMPYKDGTVTLGDAAINGNKIVTNGDGLYHDSNGYYYKGNVGNNYVLFGNRLFRIIRVNADNAVRVVSEDNNAVFMWGDNNYYYNSNIRNWLSKTEKEHSGVYYDTIPNPTKFLVKTTYSEDKLNDKKITSGKRKNDYITTLSISDYTQANGKSSYLNTGKIFYLLGLDSEGNNLYVEDDGSVQSCDNLDTYGVRSVFTFNSNIKITGGDGTKDNPYVINQENDTNYINSYIKLGEDTWKVYEEKDNKLKLYLDGYIKIDNNEVVIPFSNNSSYYNTFDNTNIAFFLNNTYLNSLSYLDLLLENDYNRGELSIEAGYDFTSIYSDVINCKVGLLNIFDYNNSTNNDYFMINQLSGNLGYITNNGLIEEVDLTEAKHIVPVISIDKTKIKNGKGTSSDPYTVG